MRPQLTTTRETYSPKQYKPNLAMRLAIARAAAEPTQVGMSSKIKFVSHDRFRYDR